MLALNYPDDNLGQYPDLKETVGTNKRDDGRRVLNLPRYCNPQCFSPQCLHSPQCSTDFSDTLHLVFLHSAQLSALGFSPQCLHSAEPSLVGATIHFPTARHRASSFIGLEVARTELILMHIFIYSGSSQFS